MIGDSMTPGNNNSKSRVSQIWRKGQIAEMLNADDQFQINKFVSVMKSSKTSRIPSYLASRISRQVDVVPHLHNEVSGTKI
jgi:hypothetical protein